MNAPKSVLNDADPTAISIEQARTRILGSLKPCTQHELIDTASALGRVIAENVVSESDVPSFRASAMDGYAVRSGDCTMPLTLVGQSLAGHPGLDSLAPYCTQRITTGARVPDEADAVVQQENTSLDTNTVVINQLPSPGLHIRNPGSDSAKGAVLLKTGDRIGPAELALLAAHGHTHIRVLRQLRVAVFSTGDELVEPGAARQPGQIFDANRALLLSLLQEPSVQLLDLGITGDSEDELQQTIDATKSADIVISSGGVSVGDADFVKTVLARNGQLNIWKIAMKPGRPLTFGFLGPAKAFFGLPGNPVSAALTCLLFVKPAIDHMLGVPVHDLPPLELPLRGELRKNPGRVEYQRAVIIRDDSGHWEVTTTGVQDSHVLTSLHNANCLVELPIESKGAVNREMVRVFPFTHYAASPL